ncbi:glycosyltransferase family 2 protein [Flavobacterium chuncheonense]|uniref:Glycosyltransferase family 2 protein n=1 Tax=Flavobacterium chuncheonense TaxID=2026653 RepID=A0ABW5YK67_9FLAO
MKLSLIICTYKRPKALKTVLNSVKAQSIYPDEIIIVDGSPDKETAIMLEETSFSKLKYYQVLETDRGLTKQRNFGIQKRAADTNIVCFLDDDTILAPTYFEEILKTYENFPEALGVGGYITNEVTWQKVEENKSIKKEAFVFDGYKRKEGARWLWRRRLGLDSDAPPGFLPECGHGRSIGFLPPSGKTYRVEQLMGGVASFKKEVLDTFQFSTYFEGYGLYEDADFTLRVSKTGKLYVNTAAQLEHHHDAAGRPNQYQYGKMVVRNGWYVWRVKYPNPSFNAKIKWHAITLLLIAIRATNTMTTTKRKEAFTETLGRTIGWFSLFIKKPK